MKKIKLEPESVFESIRKWHESQHRKDIVAAAVLAVLSIALSGCGGQTKIDGVEVTNGTTVLLFPEWTNSASAFERVVYSNYYAVYQDGKWFTRERQNADGTLAVFWQDDKPESTIEDAKMAFGLNIGWAVDREMYDAFNK